MPFTRSLRRLAPRKWAVIIDTHTAADLGPDPLGYDVKIDGLRPLGEPVAVIVQRGDTYHAHVQKWVGSREPDGDGPIYEYPEIGTDSDLRRLAKRIAEGEFDYDFRFEIIHNPEPDDPASMYYVTQYAVPSQIESERFGTDRPYDAVEAAREVQAIPMEERWDMYAERGW